MKGFAFDNTSSNMLIAKYSKHRASELNIKFTLMFCNERCRYSTKLNLKL